MQNALSPPDANADRDGGKFYGNGPRRFLAGTQSRPLDQIIRFSLTLESLLDLKEVLYEVMQRVLETRLNSLACGKGIL